MYCISIGSIGVLYCIVPQYIVFIFVAQYSIFDSPERAEERVQARAARLRAEEETIEPDRQRAAEAPQTHPPAAPERIFRTPQITAPRRRPRNQTPPPPRRAIPHTPPSQSALRSNNRKDFLLRRPQTVPRKDRDSCTRPSNSNDSPSTLFYNIMSLAFATKRWCR